MNRTARRFGWIPDLPDRRDHLFSAPAPILQKLPRKVNLTKLCPPIYDQGMVGSCTGNAIAAAVQFNRMKNKQEPGFIPSRLFIYYNERAMEGTVNADPGAMIRDGIKSVSKLGVCPETMWPYDGNPFPDDPGDGIPANTRLTHKPSQACYTEAAKHQVISYQRLVQNISQLRGSLAAGYPFVFGVTVYESIYNDSVSQTGDISMPGDGESIVGGHAMLAVGYDDATRVFIIRNSWGKAWGKKGYGTIPYSYLNDSTLASDLWTLRTIEG
jgi:C1A family cysteine protease